MSDPRYGYPYVPVYYPNKAPPPYASHPPGDQRLHTHPANVSGSSSSTSKLQKQRARPQMDEDPLPRHFLPPAVNGDKSKSVREIRHRHEMLQATYDKLTSNERISDETNQSMHHALRVHAAPAAPGTYRFLPPTNLSWGTSIDPNPAYAYSSCATLPVNMDSLPENFQPYADSPTKKESSRLKSGSLVIVRTSKMGRWKVGTYLSDDWYRESDGTDRHYYQVRDLDGNSESYSYLPEDFSCIPSDDTPQVTPYDKEQALTMIRNRLVKPPTRHSFLFAALPTKVRSPMSGIVSTYKVWHPVMCLEAMRDDFGYSARVIAGDLTGGEYIVYTVKPYCGL